TGTPAAGGVGGMPSHRAKPRPGSAGGSLRGHALASARAVGPQDIAVVVAPDMGAVRAEALAQAPGVALFEQATQSGTADALLAAAPALERHAGDVLVLFVDTPLIETSTLKRLLAGLDAANIAVLGFEPDDSSGYGRLLLDAGGHVAAIREHKDASADERSARLCNAGAMAFRVPSLTGLIGRVRNDNASREYYLTD